MYRSPNIVRVIKSTRLRWAGHVAKMEKRSSSIFKILKVNLQERDLQEGLDVDGKTILEWILKKYMSIRGIELIQLGIGVIGEPL